MQRRTVIQFKNGLRRFYSCLLMQGETIRMIELFTLIERKTIL